MATLTSPLSLRSLVRSSRFGGGLRGLLRPSVALKAIVAGGMLLVPRLVVWAQTTPQSTATTSARDIIDQILSFIYSLGHLIGEGVVRLVVTILPSMQFPQDLVDPIGLLAILTIFLAIAAIAKKLVWIVVIAGWVLILVRLILVIVQNYM